jgi:hypothetical protein
MITTAVRPTPTLRRPTPRQQAQVHITGDTIDAISMPAPFAALVQTELEIMMLAGPVTTDPDGSSTFLTQPATSPNPKVPTDLLPLGVRLIPTGTPVVLPTSNHRPAIWSTVIGAARRVAHRERAHRAVMARAV